MVNSILILAVIVLPGWISVSAAQRYHPRIVDTTTMMVWGMMFNHAAIVHIIGVGAVAAALMLCPGYFLDALDLDRALTDGAVKFMQDSPGTALAAFGAYLLWMVVGSTISGVANLPARFTLLIGRVAQVANLAPEPVEEESIWYSALNLGRKRSRNTSVHVFIQMKNGGIYIGNLKSYPILPDSVESKDIMLGSCVWYPTGDSSSRVDLEFGDDAGEGGVLLNTSNIDNVHYWFFDDYGDADGDSANAD